MSIPETISRSTSASAPRCCGVGGHLAEGSQFARERGRLLHRRLQVVALIALVPSVLFLIRNVVEDHRQSLMGPVGVVLHAIVTTLLAWLAAMLWVRQDVSVGWLRRLEVALFGSLAVFFGWLQVCTFRHDPLFQAADAVPSLEVIRLWIDSTEVRWFFLIVCYGVFIPNSWKRCAVVAGIGAAVPLLLTPLAAWQSGRLSVEVLYGTMDLAILMGTALAVAIFGSYRFEMLQREAFQARQLGQYRLKQKLGSGGMGEVYLGEHLLLRRPCAIKLIRPDQRCDPAVLHRFEREVQTMATLTHPNTVEVYDYGRSDDGTFYYVMEYLPGLNLETLVLRHGPLPAARAVHFLRQVCGALREAHEIGLLHRDIKPSNIIACERGGVPDVAKLLDFGLVQGGGLHPDAARVTIQGTVLGSPPYMSPEQAAGKGDVDARADIYSLGGVGYFLLTGQPPFARETAMEMLLAHAYEPVVPAGEVQAGVPADVEAVILRCLSKKPEDRFPDVRSLDQALAACGVAGAWGEEQARQWWQSHRDVPETAAVLPAMVTPAGR
jgi:serine/threonine-protein kinase